MKDSLVYRTLLAHLRGEHFKGNQDPFPHDFENPAYGVKYFLFEKGFFETIRKRWNASDEKIIERGLVELPTYIENRLICEQMKKRFGSWIFTLPVFTNDELTYDRRTFKQGFMRPVFEEKLTIGFEVFRSIKDKEPIVLTEKVLELV